MKTIKRVISLVMAVIMLFTGTPALQASDLAFDRAQLAELQQEISPLVTDSAEFDGEDEINDDLSSLKKLQRRYKEAIKKYKELDTREARRDVKTKKQKALEIANQMEEFDQFETDERKAEVAFYTFLYNSTLLADAEMEVSKKEFPTGFILSGVLGFGISTLVTLGFDFSFTDFLLIGGSITAVDA